MKRQEAIRGVFFWLALCLLPGSAAWGETEVRATLDPPAGTADQLFVLQLRVLGDDGRQIQEPYFESSEQFRIERRGTSSRHMFVNGVATSEIIFNFAVAPAPGLAPGEYPLPSGYITVGGKRVGLKLPRIKIQQIAPTLPEAKRATGLDFVQLVDNTAPYVGQQVLYRVEVATSRQVRKATLDEADLKGVWRESFGKEREVSRLIANSGTTVHSLREAVFPQQPGELLIPARSLSAEVRGVPQRRAWGDFMDNFFDDIFEDYEYQQRRVIAEGVKLAVQPLPPAPAGAGPYIPVGKLRFKVEIDRDLVKEGENITVKAELEGDANLRPLELHYVPGPESEFRVYADQPELETRVDGQRVIFTKRFSFAVVAQRSGEFTLPALRVLTFDPEAGRYQWLEGTARKVRVLADAAAQQLRVAAAEEARSPAPRAHRELEQLGEDLLPQHVGTDLFAASRPVPGALRWLVLLAAPFLACGVGAVAGYRRRLQFNPELVAQRNAYRKAAEALQATTPDAVELARVLRTYLGERLRCRGGSLTPIEARELVTRHTGNPALGEETEQLLGRLERLTYGGSAAAQAPAAVLSALLERIEAGVRRG